MSLGGRCKYGPVPSRPHQLSVPTIQIRSPVREVEIVEFKVAGPNLMVPSDTWGDMTKKNGDDAGSSDDWEGAEIASGLIPFPTPRSKQRSEAGA